MAEKHKNLGVRRVHMQRILELREEIENVRTELDESLLQKQKYNICYQKSIKLDKLIEEYIIKMNNKKEYL